MLSATCKAMPYKKKVFEIGTFIVIKLSQSLKEPTTIRKRGGIMMKFFSKLAVFAAVIISAAGLSAFADEGTQVAANSDEVVALREQVKDLTSKLSSLASKVTTMQGHIAATQGKESQAIGAIVPSGQEAKGGLIHTMQDIHMGGYLDIQYNQNLTNVFLNNAAGVAAAIPGGSGGAPSGGNPARVFDNNQNTFSMNAAVLEFQKDPNPEGGVGFRFDLAAGNNATVVDLATDGVQNGDVTFEQAYIDIVAPLSFLKDSEIFDDVVDIKIGRFWTLAGAEVVRSPDNWNISRSLAFGFAIPFSHTGVRATYKLFKDKVTTWWGLNNGWDNVIDRNKQKTMEGGFSFSPIENLTLTSSVYLGAELAHGTAGGANHRRFVLSNVALWNATDKLSFMGEINFGNQMRVAGLEGTTAKSAQWHSYAGYARYKLTDKMAVVSRTELFVDDDTFRFLGASAGKDHQNIWEQTFTLEYGIYENLIGRLEYRLDKSDDTDVFNGHMNQQTIGGQLIYTFA